MTTTQHGPRRDLALTIITAVIGLAATGFAIAATSYMLSL
jgi:hypothetical protein